MQSFATSRRPNHRHSLMAAPLLVAFACLPLGAQIGSQPEAKPAPGTPASSTLPATPPTVAPVAATAAATQPEAKPHRAEVTFTDGQLSVRANNSSLHQILRSISRITGMTITGGVEDQRVFGSYGPGNASTILATLLDGTGVNMLIREGDSHQPTELTLTPRSGGSAPAITPQDEEIGSDQPVAASGTHSLAPGEMTQVQITPSAGAAQPPSGPRPIVQPLNNPLGSPNNTTPTASQFPTTNSVPIDSIPTPSTAQQPAQGIVDSPNPPPGTSTPLTPEQVYQKMLQMQKDKAAGTTPAPTSTPPPQ
jgi:hypothetical protein